MTDDLRKTIIMTPEEVSKLESKIAAENSRQTTYQAPKITKLR